MYYKAARNFKYNKKTHEKDSYISLSDTAEMASMIKDFVNQGLIYEMDIHPEMQMSMEFDKPKKSRKKAE